MRRDRAELSKCGEQKKKKHSEDASEAEVRNGAAQIDGDSDEYRERVDERHAAARRRRGARRVGVAQRAEGFCDFLENGGRLWMIASVGVVEQRERAVPLLDVVGAAAPVEAEDAVVVRLAEDARDFAVVDFHFCEVSGFQCAYRLGCVKGDVMSFLIVNIQMRCWLCADGLR